MESVELVTLDDGAEYMIIDEIEGSNKYVYLVCTQDESKFVIRKEIKENDEAVLVGLKDDKEFDEAIVLYQKKYVPES